MTFMKKRSSCATDRYWTYITGACGFVNIYAKIQMYTKSKKKKKNKFSVGKRT